MAKEVDRARLVFERASIHAANGELLDVFDTDLLWVLPQ